jgi:hypothetical protein
MVGAGTSYQLSDGVTPSRHDAGMQSHRSSHPSASRPQLFGVPTDVPPADESVLRRAVRLADPLVELVDGLASNVGGLDALETLHSEPLPSLPFHWGAVPPAETEQVMRIVARLDSANLWFLDVEDRAIVDRLLEEVLVRHPKVVRQGDAARTAAALVWLALQGNARLGGRRRVFALDVWQAFGVTSCSERGRRLHAALELEPVRAWSYPRLAGAQVRLCRVSMLHSVTRARLIAAREALSRHIEQEWAARAPVAAAEPSAAGAPPARQVTPIDVERVETSSGRVIVRATIASSGDDHEQVGEVVQLSVSDARALLNMLSHALDGAAPDGPHLRLCT